MEHAVIRTNPTTEMLMKYAVLNHEGVLSQNGALTVVTGKRTGRSPKDRFIVKDEITANTIDWGAINQPVSPDVFNKLWKRAEDFIARKKSFVSQLQVGADDELCIPVKVITDTAWQHLFAQHLFIRPQKMQDEEKMWTLLSVSQFECDPARDGTNSEATVMLDLNKRRVLICGMRYAALLRTNISPRNMLFPWPPLMASVAVNSSSSTAHLSIAN